MPHQSDSLVPPSLDTNLKFSSVDMPMISIHDYLGRISHYSECSPSCYITALIYVDRVMMAHKDMIINSYCIHR
jgi:hypothetical protein